MLLKSEASQQSRGSPKTKKPSPFVGTTARGPERSPLGLPQQQVQPAQRYTVTSTKARVAVKTKRRWCDTPRTRPRWKE